jgi:hypothetical protein
MLAASLVLPCLPLFAQAPVVKPAVEPPQTPPPPTAPAAPLEATRPRPQLRTIHRQVSRLPLEREYRSVPVGDAATLAVHETIDAALARAWNKDANFTETPLRDMVAQVRNTLQVPLVLDMKGLEDAGIDLDTLVTHAAQATSTRAALRRILADLDLTWMIRGEALVITTKERASEDLEVRLYPLPWGCRTQAVVDVQSLIDLIQNAIDGPEAWADFGGSGMIRPQGDGANVVLVVTQTVEMHDAVEALLRSLHDQALAEFGGPKDLPAAKTPTVRVHHVADAAVRRDLAAKLVELCNTSLPHGADPQAKVTTVGDCLAVQSVAPEFHALAGQLIRAVAGEHVPDTDSNTSLGGEVGAGKQAVRGVSGNF